MPGVTIHFLLVYSHGQQELLKCQEFDEVESAMAAYAEVERQYANESDAFEVVLVGADSIETVMKTHGHYFRKASESLFSEFLIGA